MLSPDSQAYRARRQAETPLSVLCRIPEPPLTPALRAMIAGYRLHSELRSQTLRAVARFACISAKTARRLFGATIKLGSSEPEPTRVATSIAD
jgi:hypothetical protein